MAQNPDIIDLRRSYLPVPPDAFPITLHDTGGEDSPEARIPVIPYDGYNFMPTPQGYASFFGINSGLDIDALVTPNTEIPLKVDDVFIMQTDELENILVALTSVGIWVKDGSATGSWTHTITLVDPGPDIILPWSKCVIDNIVYVYRQGESYAYQASEANSYVFTQFAPAGINMTGQMGIFKAGGRLAFWDSANSVGWSSLTSPLTFGDAEQLSGFTIFQDIVGKIVLCLQHGDGFIIYCTKSIVHVSRNPASPMLFSGRSVFNNNGIAYRREAVFADPDTLHFAFTTNGIVEITGGQSQIVMPEIGTYFKEKRQPIFLSILNGRYLFFTILNEEYFTGRVNFHTEFLGGSTLSFAGARRILDAWEDGNLQQPCRALNVVEKQRISLDLYDRLGFLRYTQATLSGSVRIWGDRLNTWITMARLIAYKNKTAGFYGDYLYFEDGVWSDQTLVIPTQDATFALGGVIPDIGLITASETVLPQQASVTTSEANEQNFWMKQEFLWELENNWTKDFIKAIERHQMTPDTIVATKEFLSVLPTGLGIMTATYGPYVDMQYQSERNRMYGVGAKSAWLDRSLVRKLYVDVDYEFSGAITSSVLVGWSKFAGTGGADTYASLAAALAGVKAHYISVHGAGDVDITMRLGTGFYALLVSRAAANVKEYRPTQLYGDLTGPAYIKNVRRASEVYLHTSNTVTVRKVDSRIRYVEVAPCLYREIGYTVVTGHGHYTTAGVFVVDNATAEAHDYVDSCVAVASKRPTFQGIALAGPFTDGNFCGTVGPVTIAAEEFEYPDRTVTIPGDDVLFQDGGNEPYYPTFLGAHVFDIQYKKWGKMREQFKHLLDLYPINNVAGDGTIPYDTFLPKSAMLNEDGVIKIFDQYPEDSQIVFGKYGQYRTGFTELEEVLIQHRTPMSGRVVVESSFNGRDVEPSLTVIDDYTATRQHNGRYSLSGRWYNIIVEGNYDLTHMEARAHRSSRR